MAETMQRGRGPREYTERAKERNKRGFEVAKKRSGVNLFSSLFFDLLLSTEPFSSPLALALARSLLSPALSRSLALYLAG